MGLRVWSQFPLGPLQPHQSNHSVNMIFPLCLTLLVVLHNVASEETKPVEAKYAGRGYGYNNYGGGGHNQGYGGNSGYGRGHGKDYTGYGGNSGHRSYGHSHGHDEKHSHHVPIKIPYLDRNGCRFPGDVVCDPDQADPPITFNYCVLSDENKNLWKKPSMTVTDSVVDCADIIADTGVLSDFCNDNERLLKAAGLIQDKTPDSIKNYHQLKYTPLLNPCIVNVPP